MNIYDINAELQVLLDNLEFDRDTGELNSGFNDKLTALHLSKQEMALNCGRSLKNLRAESMGLQNEIDRLLERQRIIDKKYNAVKLYLTDTCAGEKYADSTCEIKWRKSSCVEILNDKLIPKDYIITKTSDTVSKTLIHDAIMQGAEVPGAKLIEKYNLLIK